VGLPVHTVAVAGQGRLTAVGTPGSRPGRHGGCLECGGFVFAAGLRSDKRVPPFPTPIRIDIDRIEITFMEPDALDGINA